MATRKLRVTTVDVDNGYLHDGKGPEVTRVSIVFNRKLTALEVSGVKAVLDGEIK